MEEEKMKEKKIENKGVNKMVKEERNKCKK
jgi:hypothetical protein